MASYQELKKKAYTESQNQTSRKNTTVGATGFTYEELKKKARNEQLDTDVQRVDDSYLKTFADDAQKFYDSSMAEYDKIGWVNASSKAADRRKAMEDLDYRRSVIRKWLDGNKSRLSQDSYQSVSDLLDSYSKGTKSVLDSFDQAAKYYAQWETEDDYNAYVGYQKDLEEKSAYDVQAGRREIEDLEKQMNNLRLQHASASFGPTAKRDNLADQYVAQIQQLEDEITRKKQYANQSQFIQENENLKDVTRNVDFTANSGYVSTIDENPAWGMSGVGDQQYEWINNRDGFRDTYEQDMARLNTMAGGSKTESPYTQKGYDRMTGTEVSIYNYYYAMEGPEKAQQYLDSIQEQLNQRKAEEVFAGMEGKTGRELAFGVEAGLDQFKSGMESLINTQDHYIPQSATQIASGMVREDLADDSIPMWYNFKTGQWEDQILGSSAGQAAYDAITTSANMAPSILTSIAVGMINPVAGQVAGSALMGASAAGSAYQEKLNAGYDKDQARSYGILVGASEIVMEKLLGGITKLGGGMISRTILKNLSAVDNVLARFAKSMGGQILMGSGSEALEEGVQSVLEPYIWEAITGEEASIDWQEALYNALLGFATGSLFEGPDVIRSRVSQNRQAKQMYGASQQELVGEALEINPENTFAQKMQGRLNRGSDLTGGQLNRLVEQNEAAMTAQDKAAIQKAAAQRLTELGETKNVEAIAAALTKQAAGEELSMREHVQLRESKYGQRVANELNAENIRSGEYASGWAEQLNTNRINPEEYGRMAEAAQQPQMQVKTQPEKVDAQTQNVAQEAKEEPVTATVREIRTVAKKETVPANDRQMAGKLAAEESSEVAETTVEQKPPKTIEEASKAYGEQAGAMMHTYTAGQNVAKYDAAYRMAYDMGRSGVKLSYVKNSRSTAYLTNTQKELAYEAGKAAATASTTVLKNNSSVYFMDGKNVTGFDMISDKYNDVRMAGVQAAKILNQLELGGKYFFYKSYEKNGGWYYKDSNGNEKPAPNGIFRAQDGSIYIDLNAGNRGQGVTLYALSHELGHFVKANSQDQFNRLADLVSEAFGNTDLTMEQRVEKKQEMLSEIRGEEVSYDEAYEEVVCDALSTMLSDGRFYEKVAEIKVKDKGLFNTIKRFFRELMAKFERLYSMIPPDQQDARDIREMKEMFDKIQTAFAEALVEASDNFLAVETEAVESLGENAKVETNANGELLLAANERGNVLVYSERTYLDGGREKLEMALRQNGHTDAEIKDTLSYVDDALDYIKILAAGYAKNMGYTNLSNHLVADIVTNVKTGKQVMSAIVNNGDYPVNIDLSLICKKRVAYMNLMSRLIRDGVFDKVNYGGAAIAEVNEILRENGFETACLGCFVESRRLQFQAWAETIVSEWNAEVDKRNPNAENFGFANGEMEALTDENINELTRELESVKKNDQGNSVTRMGRLLDALPSLQKKLTIEDLLTPEGLTALRKHDGSLFSIVKSRYGAASPKIVQDFNPYAGEIAMLTFAQVKGITNNAVKGAQAYVTEVKREYGKLKKNNDESKADFNQRKKDHEQKIQDEAMRRYLYDIGGARIQSFSDFMIENVFDYIQIFADLAAKRLPLHGYSKEIVAIRLFGMTGAKWNGSLIAHVERSMGKELAGLLPVGTKDGIPVTVDGKDYVIGFDDYARNEDTGGKSFIQSIGMKDIVALQLDPRYSPYVGSITIGVSDAQILAMLDSPMFRMVIPYHASGMLPQFAKLVGVDMYNDYTDYQNTTVRQYYDLNGNAVTELKNAKGEIVKADTSFAFNAEIQKTKDAKTAADNYLKWCAQRHEVYDGSKLVGYATFNPKFSSSPYGNDFTRHENYYKLLEDFNTYDCLTEESTVQGAVTMNFPSEENRLTAQQMDAYKQAMRDTGIFSEKDIEKYAKNANMTFKEIINAEVGNRANYAAAQAPKWEATVKAVEEKLQKDYARDEKYSERSNGFQEHDVISAVYTIRNEKAARGHDLVKIGTMPSIYSELFGLSGDVYVSNEHLYQNMVSRDTAIAEGRYNEKASADYHDLGEPKIINAIEQFQDPLVIMESLKDYKEPRLVAILDEKGNDKQNLVAVMELYATMRPHGVSQLRNHVLITIYEKSSLPDYVEKTADKDRILHIKEGSHLTSQAGLQLAGEMSKETLKKNVARFNKKVNAFKEKNDIRYSERTGESVSNRSLLANAFEGISRNSVEYEMIQDYRNRVEELNKLEDRMHQLNDEIRKLRFGTTGPRDTERLNQLEEERDKTVKAINRYDRRLLNMEAAEPLRRVIDRERKKAAQKTKEHAKEIQQNKKVRAEQAELRAKIRKTIRDLDKILNRGNKKQNVKQDMQGFVSKALELADYLFTDHVSNDELIRKGIDADLIRGQREEQLLKETEAILTKLYDEADSLTDEEFTRLDAKRKTNESKLRELLTAQRNKRLSTPVYQLFDDLINEYAKLENSDQDAVKAAYNVDLLDALKALMGDSEQKAALQNMRIADMTSKELETLLKAYTMVLVNVRDANKIHARASALTIGQMADKITREFGSRKIPEKKLALAAQKLSNKIGWSYEKLYYALDRIGSETFTELFMTLADSENIVMQDIMEAEEFRDNVIQKTGYNNWPVNKEIDREFMDNTGKKFKLTLAQVMSLYAYTRREGAWDHLEFGGFVFDKAALTNPRPADSYKLTKEQCEAITSLLTKEQKAFAEEMQKYLSETMGAKGNEVSMELHGIEMFTEKNYFPIHVAGQYMARAQESQAKAAAGFQSMSNAGFTHAQNRKAKAPIILEGFMEVWSDHVNEMSRYHGTVPALEDIRRVMNRSTYSNAESESTSVKQQMINAYGEEAAQYFDDLYREANSGAITDKLQATSKKLLSLFRKNSVAYSLSVLIQQPASITRAYAMIDRKYFGVSPVAAGVVKAATSKWNNAYAKAYNEMLKYAPGVTMAKEIGGFDTATGGSIRSHLMDTKKNLKQKWKTGTDLEKGKAALGAVDDNAIANLPNVADKIAWIELWNACKRETVAMHKNLTPGSEEFYEAVGKRFTEVIRATQVYDSIFAKSPMLKSKNLAVQYAVSFMNEPNTIANMAEKAARDVAKGNRKQGLITGAAVINSIIFTNVLKSVVYALRDDDEDETFIEKYIEALAGNMVNDFNPINYIAIARDVWSLAKGYDVARADMEIVADAVDALSGVINNAFTDTDDMTEEELIAFDKKVTRSNWKLVEALAAFLGIPVKNVRREIQAVIDHVRIASANAGMTTKMSLYDSIYNSIADEIPFVFDQKSKQDRLYSAIVGKDAVYQGRIEDTYKTDDSYRSAVRKALRENDPRIKEAAKAKFSGDLNGYMQIAKEIIAEKNFVQDDVVAAINSEISALEKAKAAPTESAQKATGIFKSDDFATAIASGNKAVANSVKADIIQTAQKNGKTAAEAEKSFVSSARSSLKEKFLDGTISDQKAISALTTYCGVDENDAWADVQYWAFKQKYPDVYADDSWFDTYYNKISDSGINISVYMDYRNKVHAITGDNKKERRIEVIHSMPITKEQKDALYLAEGWSENGLKKAPWH